MSCERDERYKAKDGGQAAADLPAPVYQPTTASDAVEDVSVEIQIGRQQHGRVDQRQDLHRPVVDEGEAGERHGVKVMGPAACQPQAQLGSPDVDQREEELQRQEETAAGQAAAVTRHRQVDGEGDEGDVVEGGRAAEVLGAHHELTRASAQQPAAVLPPVDGEGPEAKAEQVAAGAAQDEHGHVPSYLAPPAKDAGQHRGHNDHVEHQARNQQQDFGRGAEAEVDGDGAQVARRVVHGKEAASRWARTDFRGAAANIIKDKPGILLGNEEPSRARSSTHSPPPPCKHTAPPDPPYSLYYLASPITLTFATSKVLLLLSLSPGGPNYKGSSS